MFPKNYFVQGHFPGQYFPPVMLFKHGGAPVYDYGTSSAYGSEDVLARRPSLMEAVEYLRRKAILADDEEEAIILLATALVELDVFS